jgi:hypothetical protein
MRDYVRARGELFELSGVEFLGDLSFHREHSG